MKSAEISILIPTIGRIEYLRVAINSVLVQSLLPKQLVINFNGCDIPAFIQDTRKACDIKGVSLDVIHSSVRLSIVDSWRIGLQRSSGEYVFVLGDDDLMEPDYVEIMSSTIAREPDIDVFFSLYNRIDSSGCVIPLFKGELDGLPTGLSFVTKNSIWFEHTPQIFASAFKTKRFLASFAHHAGLAFDHWTFREMSCHGYYVFYTRTPLIKYRTHSASMTSTASARLTLDWFRGLEQFEKKNGTLPLTERKWIARSLWRKLPKSGTDSWSIIRIILGDWVILKYTLLDMINTIRRFMIPCKVSS